MTRRGATPPCHGLARGANDQQITLDHAHRSNEQAVHSLKRELRVFTRRRERPDTYR